MKSLPSFILSAHNDLSKIYSIWISYLIRIRTKTKLNKVDELDKLDKIDKIDEIDEIDKVDK